MKLSLNLRNAFFALTALSLTAGCVDATPDYRENNPIHVTAQPYNLVVAAPGAEGGLNAADLARMETFATTYIKRGEGRVIVSLMAAREETSARATALLVSNALMEQGLRAEEVDIRISPVPTVGEGEPQPANKGVLLTFTGYVADVPECGDWSENFAMEYWNGPRDGFGCATQRNMGLMVSNPRDLIQKRTAQNRDGDRAAGVMGAYKTGQDPRSLPTVSGAVATQTLGAQ